MALNGDTNAGAPLPTARIAREIVRLMGTCRWRLYVRENGAAGAEELIAAMLEEFFEGRTAKNKNSCGDK
jgi:hypothetical protein